MNWGRSVAITMLLCSSFGCGALAGTWREVMTVEMPVGERDTRARVREAAIEEMRLRASRKVGAIVEATTRSDGKQITEELKTVGVSLVQVDDIREQIKVDGRGLVLLEVRASVSVDDSELDRRATAMRVDNEKLVRIRRLSDENQLLRDSLASIASALNRRGSVGEAAMLLKRHSELAAALHANREGVGSTFAPGRLVELAGEDDAAWTRVENDIIGGVFEPLMASPVRARIESVEKLDKSYLAHVRVGWETQLAPIAKVLDRTLQDTQDYTANSGHRIIKVNGDLNRKHQKSVFSERAYRYLLQHQLVIELAVGEAKVEVPVMFYGNSFMVGDRCLEAMAPRSPVPRDDQGAVCFVSQNFKSSDLLGPAIGSRTNPLTIRLTNEQAAKANEIKATWVLKRQDGSTARKSALLLS